MELALFLKKAPLFLQDKREGMIFFPAELRIMRLVEGL